MAEKKDIAMKVREWLVEDGIYKDKIPDENADFHFLAEIPPGSGQYIDVVFPKNRDDMVVIASGVKLADQHYRSIMSLKNEKREEFLWEIKFRLLFLATGFQILPNPKDPQIFQFTRELYFDGLNKNLFMDAVKEVYRCKLFIIWMMQKNFGSETGSDGESYSIYR